MTTYRVQHWLQHANGLNRDRFVNTWYFLTSGPVTTNFDQLALAVHGFYLRDPSGSAGPVSNGLSGIADGIGSGIKIYDMADAKPREPKYEVDYAAFTAAGGTGNLPSEIAVCLSYQAALPTDVSVKRRRGRLYIGPINSVATTSSTGNNECFVNPTFRASVVQSAFDTATEANALGFRWSVYSPTGNATYPITSFWCDDAFDVQRRRGIRPTTRDVGTFAP